MLAVYINLGAHILQLDAVQEFVSPNLREKPLSMHHDRTEDEDIALPSTTRELPLSAFSLTNTAQDSSRSTVWSWRPPDPSWY